MAEPLKPITLPPLEDLDQEAQWLQTNLKAWMDEEFLPEPANQNIAQRATQVYLRQRLEGENDIGALVIAIVTEMKSFDFSQSFFGEFAIANAVSDLLLRRCGRDDRCCGSL